MSKRQFKSQASSGRVGTGFGGGFGNGFSSTHSSTLSYVQEPPDYSNISDASTVVSLKNLTKKDATTKTKALDDLTRSLSSSDDQPEEGLIAVWVALFPRLSIDNANRVRQLSHSYNGQLCSRAGKRIAKHLPKIVGAWFAGVYDSDRSSARAAQDALTLVFPSIEKVQGLRKTFHESILQYCHEATLDESVDTLSDLRVVSADDAAAVYARAVAGGLSVLASLLSNLSSEDVGKQSSDYETLLSDSKLWSFSHHEDGSVRRATHRFVKAALINTPVLISANLRLASNAYVNKGLSSDQSGSIVEYTNTILALTRADASIWTTAYESKKTPVSRLKHFLKHGSRSGPPTFWEIVTTLLEFIPHEVLPQSQTDAIEVLNAAHQGVTRREERQNSAAAWQAYIKLVSIIVKHLPNEIALHVLEACALPIIHQYLQPDESTTDWTINSTKPVTLVRQVVAIEQMITLIEREWPKYTKNAVEALKMSQPEQAKDFDKSQQQIAAAGERWAVLHREIYETEDKRESGLRKVFDDANVDLFEGCVEVLRARNGKPYGAAATIEKQIELCGATLLQLPGYKSKLADYVAEDVPKLLSSPSRLYVASAIYTSSGEAAFERSFTDLISTVLKSPEQDQVKLTTLQALFGPRTPKTAVGIASRDETLQAFFAALPATDSLSRLSRVGVVSAATASHRLASLTEQLASTSSGTVDVLSAFEMLTIDDPESIKSFVAETDGTGSQLMPSILRLEKDPNEDIAGKAAALSAQLTTALGSTATHARHNVVLQSLEEVNSSSLDIASVINLLDDSLAAGIDADVVHRLVPSLDLWKSSVNSVLVAPRLSLGLFSPLGGVAALIKNQTKSTVRYDAEGWSQALRIASYMAHFLQNQTAVQYILDTLPHCLALLSMCVQIAGDALKISGANGIWRPSTEYGDSTHVAEFVSSAILALDEVVETRSESRKALLDALNDISSDSGSNSPKAYYAALSASKLHRSSYEVDGTLRLEMSDVEAELKKARQSKNILDQVCCLSSFADPLTGSASLLHFCNELVADLTGLDAETNEASVIDKLIVLNSMLTGSDDSLVASIRKPRPALFVNHVIPWLKHANIVIRSETCKALAKFLPNMLDMYGDHWADILASMEEIWRRSQQSRDIEATVVDLNTSLKLYAALRKLAKDDDVNDDLVEAIAEHKEFISSSLIGLLRSLEDVPDEHHSPLKQTTTLLARLISQSLPKVLSEASELFSLLQAPSQAIQSAAFELLHWHIPAAQEQVSVDAALDDKTAKLPDELLSLILGTQVMQDWSNVVSAQSIPASLQGYLYSWRLVFDHFNGSSFRVKTDYIEQLKEGSYVQPLLSLTFEALGLARSRPVDVSKFNIESYVSGSELDPVKDVQWLLAHLYYLSLSNFSSLLKGSYLEIRSRGLSQAVDTWTSKYISPIIIAASLQEVADWAEKSVKEDPDYEAMTVKVGMKSREINVSYLVDEHAMAIKIELPEAYPLASAQVISVNRVAAKEEKWQSWLRNCRGVITFSNGSITDGLSAWRRNVTGALKGQTECAICYSIISAAKELPTKRCPTCKNLFHSSCLFKWFNTSNSSGCPLCRNSFSFH